MTLLTLMNHSITMFSPTLSNLYSRFSPQNPREREFNPLNSRPHSLTKRHLKTKVLPFNPTKLEEILDGRIALGSFVIIRLASRKIGKSLFLYISNANNDITE
jgi:hypothetical protein